MTFSTTNLTTSGGVPFVSAAELTASTTTPVFPYGAIYKDLHPTLGPREFKYVQFHAAASRGDSARFLDPISVTNITSGATTSVTLTGAGWTANLYKGGLLRCLDDAGGAGAAPEGEIARIKSNTTDTIYLESSDAFSTAPAANDDFQIILPWAVQDAAAGDVARNVAGVAMATQAQYSWGWVQYKGLNPYVNVVAAGTAITTKKSLITGTNVLTDGSTSAAELRVGFAMHAVTSDTVARYALVDLNCGPAFSLGASA